MSCQHAGNEIDTDMFGLPEDNEYTKETDTRDELFRDSQPMLKRKICTSHMHETPYEMAENAHSRRLPPEDQTTQRSEADAETIGHSLRLCREDKTAWGLVAAITKSTQVSTSTSSSSSTSADRESCHKKSRQSLCTIVNCVHSHRRSIRLCGSYGKPATRSLEQSHVERKHIDSAQ